MAENKEQVYSEEFLEWAQSEHMQAFIKEVRMAQENMLMETMVASHDLQNRLCDQSSGMEAIIRTMEAINED